MLIVTRFARKKISLKILRHFHNDHQKKQNIDKGEKCIEGLAESSQKKWSKNLAESGKKNGPKEFYYLKDVQNFSSKFLKKNFGEKFYSSAIFRPFGIWRYESYVSVKLFWENSDA